MKFEDDDKDDENVEVKYFHNKSSKICLRFTQDKKTSHLLFLKLEKRTDIKKSFRGSKIKEFVWQWAD